MSSSSGPSNLASSASPARLASSASLHPREGARFLFEREFQREDLAQARYRAAIFTPDQRFEYRVEMHLDGAWCPHPGGQVVTLRALDPRDQRGMTLVEVLVTVVILAIGLLGLVGLQARLQVLQIESYQCAQALMLLKDMAGRITNNRNNAAAYVTGADNPIGVGACPTDTSTRRSADVAEWCNLLQGASEETTAGSRVGAMVGGRGCVEDLGNGQYLVTVAWHGLAPISAPPESVACGAGDFDGSRVDARPRQRRQTADDILQMAGNMGKQAATAGPARLPPFQRPGDERNRPILSLDSNCRVSKAPRSARPKPPMPELISRIGALTARVRCPVES